MISVKNIPSNEKGGRAPGAPPLGSAHACQHPTTQFFTGRMPFLPPNQQRQSTEG